jgi:peptidoglycan/LPS O-acetylase OafA/YrhL
MGLIRLFLALVVVADHLRIFTLAPAGMENGAWKLGLSGPTAVMCFYIISGYLIAYVLDNRYGYDTKGVRLFYAARASRIYSLYWPLLGAMLVTNFVNARHIFSNPLDGFIGIFLFGADWRMIFTDFPLTYWSMLPFALAPAWTLACEMTFYALAPFLLRDTRIAVAVLATSFGLHITLRVWFGYTDSLSFEFLPATLWFFLLGAIAARARPMRSLSVAALILAIWLSTIAGRDPIWDNPWFLSAAFCFALALPGVFAITGSVSWMNFLGDLSYPVYLLHMSVLYALFMQPTWGAPIGRAIMSIGNGEIITACVAAICVSCSFPLHFLVERPLRPLLANVFQRVSTRRRSVRQCA